MKRYLLFMLMTFCTVAASASPTEFLVLWDKSNAIVAYAITDRPEITFTATDLVVKCKKVVINYDLAHLSRFSYETDDYTGISDVTADVQMKKENESLIFSGLPQGSQIQIFSLDGKAIDCTNVPASGNYVYPISHLTTGIYLVKAHHLTYKLQIK